MFSWFGSKRKRGPVGTEAQRSIYIPEDLYRRMINHCREERPLEACGLLGGTANLAEVGYACDNVHRSPRIYQVDDRQLVEAHGQLRGERRELIAIYHSHVETEAIPSRTDIDQATWPEAFYLIVTLKRRRPQVRAWRIVDRQVTEHPVVVVKEQGSVWRDLRKAVRAIRPIPAENDIP